jgi:hypothetical protein
VLGGQFGQRRQRDFQPEYLLVSTHDKSLPSLW